MDEWVSAIQLCINMLKTSGNLINFLIYILKIEKLINNENIMSQHILKQVFHFFLKYL